MDKLTEAGVQILLAIVGVAIIAVIVSMKSNTAGVIQAAASGFGNDLGVAISPVTGNNYNINLSYPGSNNGLLGAGSTAMMDQGLGNMG